MTMQFTGLLPKCMFVYVKLTQVNSSKTIERALRLLCNSPIKKIDKWAVKFESPIFSFIQMNQIIGSDSNATLKLKVHN